MKKILSALALGLLMCLSAPSAQAEIAEGAIVKTATNPDVYIIKYNAGKRYKRLVLNPLVFSSYGHLKWENLLTIAQWEMDTFATSSLVRVDGTTEIYELVPEGDTGGKYLITSLDGLDNDSVYTINSTDFNNYTYRGIKTIAPTNHIAGDGKVSVSEIQPYLSGVAEIQCTNSTTMAFGSGTLLKDTNRVGILTNKHVIAGMTSCYAITHQNGDYHPQGIYKLDMATAASHPQADVAVMDLVSPVYSLNGFSVASPPVHSLNFSLSNLNACDSTMAAIGSQVVILGYPVFAQVKLSSAGGSLITSSPTVTEGLISGYSPTSQALGLPYFDYYTSAKIDSGNSGGIALMEENGQICGLGLPTWLSTGNYENIGIVHNFHNVTAQ